LLPELWDLIRVQILDVAAFLTLSYLDNDRLARLRERPHAIFLLLFIILATLIPNKSLCLLIFL